MSIIAIPPLHILCTSMSLLSYLFSDNHSPRWCQCLGTPSQSSALSLSLFRIYCSVFLFFLTSKIIKWRKCRLDFLSLSFYSFKIVSCRLNKKNSCQLRENNFHPKKHILVVINITSCKKLLNFVLYFYRIAKAEKRPFNLQVKILNMCL